MEQQVSIRVETEQFKNSHGKEPSGLGTWLFSKSRDCSTVDFEFTGMYSNSKWALHRYVKARPQMDQTATWYVMP